MVSLTKSTTVEHLLARFRTAQPHNAPPTTPPNQAPIAVMVATEDDTPSTPGQEVVRYELPTTQRETRSQLDREARADAGDLKSRLDMIDINAAEKILARRFCKHQPDRSILSYLRDPGDDIAPYQAASLVLEELADQTEETALESALVFRYIQTNQLWRGHWNTSIQSAEDLVRSLDRSDIVQANIIIGTSAQHTKRNCIGLIEKAWGPGWFEKIPQAMRHPTWLRPEECSKRLLTQMAANVKQGIMLQDAVPEWEKAIQQRNDYGARKALGIKSKATPHLIPSDIAKLNRDVGLENLGKRTSEMFSPLRAKEDRLEVQLIPPASTHPIATPPNYAEGSRPKTATAKKKRKRVREEQEEEEKRESEWRTSKDGKGEVKRVRNLLVRRPIEEIPETDSSSSPGPGPSQLDTSTGLLDKALSSMDPTPSSEGGDPPQLPPPQRQTPRPPLDCEGPALGGGIRKMIALFSEVDSLYTAGRCCDRCRDHCQRAVRCMQEELEPIVHTLENISTHSFGNGKVPSTQDTGISPYKPHGQRSSIFLPDDSDVD